MNIKIFKISFRQITFLILISGAIIFSSLLADKVLVGKIQGGYAVATNFCENYSTDVRPLINAYELGDIQNKYLKKDIVISVNSQNIYSLKMRNINNKIYFNDDAVIDFLSDLRNMEIVNFKKFYEDVQLNCNRQKINVFRLMPAVPILDNYSDNSGLPKSFKWLFLFIALYLALISYKYMRLKTVRRNS